MDTIKKPGYKSKTNAAPKTTGANRNQLVLATIFTILSVAFAVVAYYTY